MREKSFEIRIFIEKAVRAKAIFCENEKDEAQDFLDDIQIGHPRMKMFHLRWNTIDHNSMDFPLTGGWAVSSKRALTYYTKHELGSLDILK